MSSTEDKVRGTGNDAVGNVKQVVGKAIGNEQMEAEGKTQEAKGEAQKAMGHAKDSVGNAAENVGDAIKGSGN